ncbi:hypothetical protein [Desulfopila sp. IMCC35008]|uniref:hypothetical protein n=1 Tax=Desulfopila sp. IMCC35008 TaxID=2653858 RepID=UPI0013D88D77|nr:hypothetical protein [Desulfopila sp. IMCC35008]
MTETRGEPLTHTVQRIYLPLRLHSEFSMWKLRVALNDLLHQVLLIVVIAIPGFYVFAGAVDSVLHKRYVDVFDLDMESSGFHGKSGPAYLRWVLVQEIRVFLPV